MHRFRIAKRPHPDSSDGSDGLSIFFTYDVEEFDHLYLGKVRLPIGQWNYAQTFATKDEAETYISLSLRYCELSKEYC
jgi:hypothetical protein